jgi:hypothetical protein
LDTASDEGEALGAPLCCSEVRVALLRNDISLEKDIPWELLKCNTTINAVSCKKWKSSVAE